jgi:ribose transport system substrate-binding protein
MLDLGSPWEMLMLRRIVAFLLLVTVILLRTACDDRPSNASVSSPSQRRQIAVIAKSTVNAFWKAVEAGARQAAQEANVEIIWTGPDAETNHTQQAAMVDNMVNRGVAGIVLAPTNVDALVRPVESAVARGVPIVIIDSPVNTQKPLSVIATDNYAAGRQAAEALIKAIGSNRRQGGSIIMLRYLEGSGSTEARERGFVDRIKQEAGLQLAESAYTKGGGSTTDAADTADALLRRYLKNGEVEADGIFASNQPTAIGMLRKIDQFRAQGTTIAAAYVGFDSHEVLLAGVREGKIAALVVQDPKQMGYLGLQTMLRHLNGEKVDPNVATSTATVTKENIDEPHIRTVTLQD